MQLQAVGEELNKNQELRTTGGLIKRTCGERKKIVTGAEVKV